MLAIKSKLSGLIHSNFWDTLIKALYFLVSWINMNESIKFLYIFFELYDLTYILIYETEFKLLSNQGHWNLIGFVSICVYNVVSQLVEMSIGSMNIFFYLPYPIRCFQMNGRKVQFSHSANLKQLGENFNSLFLYRHWVPTYTTIISYFNAWEFDPLRLKDSFIS